MAVGPFFSWGAPPSASWPLVWGDEFTGTSLDAGKWRWGSLPWGGQHHNDDYSSWITPEDSYVSNGSLWLRCRRATGNEFGGYPYSEGFVHTDGTRNYTYGYAEIRARFATGTGTWPAFWTLSQGWPPEFDVAEYFGSDDRMHMGLAYGTSWQDVQWDSSNLYHEGFGDWHTYGLEWGPGYAIWYRDGVARKSVYAGYVPAVPMYLILNSGVRWDANYAAPYQNLTQIDYCRVFSLPTVSANDNTTGTGLNQFEYVGNWGYYAAQAGAFLNDNHWSGAANDYYQVRFSGARIDVYAAVAPNHGNAAFSIDGGPEVLVDFYASTRTDKALVWSSPSLAGGIHLLKVRVTGLKNASSSGTSIPADRVDIWLSASRLAGSVIGTPGSWGNYGNTVAKVFDGNLNTFFDAPDGSGGWVGLDFGAGAGKRLTRVRYCPRSGFSSRMEGGKFQGANRPDFADAVELCTVASVPPEDRFTDQTITHTGGFRYVRYLSPTEGYCNVAELEFVGVNATIPAVPGGLVATPMHSQVALTWGPAFGAATYIVRRGLASGGPYTTIASGLTSTTFLDTGLTNSVTYYYVVASQNSAGSSSNSLEASAVPQPPGLTADFSAATAELILSWPAWATNFQLYRTTNLALPFSWSLATDEPQATNGHFQLNLVTTNSPQSYYRLGLH